MSNNNINIMDMFGNKNKSNFVIKEISLGDIINDKRNFYNTNEIEELKATIKAFGLQQNFTVCKMSDGKYKLISGHRRFKAISELVEEKEINITTVPCKIEDLTELEQYLLLIISNSTTRELTAYEKAMQVKEVRNIAEQMMQEQDNIKISVREFIKAALKMSDAEVARYEKINKSLTDEVKEEYEKGNISTDVAYQTSRLPEHKQQEVKEKIVEAAKEDKKVTSKDIEEIKKDINDIQEAKELADANEYMQNKKANSTEIVEWESEELHGLDYLDFLKELDEEEAVEELQVCKEIEYDINSENESKVNLDKNIECKECKFCRAESKNKFSGYICNHKRIIESADNYERKENQKMFTLDNSETKRFLGYGYSKSDLLLSGTLKWCPLKEENTSNLDTNIVIETKQDNKTKEFEELFQDSNVEELISEIQNELDSDNDIKCSECEFCIPHFKGSYICSHKDIKSNAEKYEKIQNKKIFSKNSMIASTKPKKPLEWCPLKNNLSNLDILTEHNIKIKPKYFTDVKNKLKTFEYRVNDRNYKVGDILNLQEYENDRYTGYVLQVEVTYILKDEYVNENYVIMSIYLIKSMFIDALRNSM